MGAGMRTHLRDLWEYAQDQWDGLIIGATRIRVAKHQRKIQERLGLGVSSDPYFQVRPVAGEFRRLLETRQYDAIAARFNQAFESKEKNAFGTPLYNVYQKALAPCAIDGGTHTLRTGEEYRQAKDALPLFDAWWDAKRGDPLAGAFCSMAYGWVSALFSDAGRGEAEDRLFREYAARELEILQECRVAGQDQYLWNFAFYDTYYATQTMGRYNLEERFERVLAFDPDNVLLYQSHLHYFRPVWGGEQEDMEHFARQCMSRVGTMPGEEIYARLYQWWIAEKYSDDFHETLCDWDLMKVGYEKMLSVHPSQALVNYYAQMAGDADDYELVLDLFEKRMTTIVPECWYDYDAKIGLHQAINAYENACDEVSGDD